jgi:hypothetical protein
VTIVSTAASGDGIDSFLLFSSIGGVLISRTWRKLEPTRTRSATSGPLALALGPVLVSMVVSAGNLNLNVHSVSHLARGLRLLPFVGMENLPKAFRLCRLVTRLLLPVLASAKPHLEVWTQEVFGCVRTLSGGGEEGPL